MTIFHQQAWDPKTKRSVCFKVRVNSILYSGARMRIFLTVYQMTRILACPTQKHLQTTNEDDSKDDFMRP